MLVHKQAEQVREAKLLEQIMKKKDKNKESTELPQENSILVRPLTMAEDLLDEIAEFVEKLVTGQSAHQ